MKETRRLDVLTILGLLMGVGVVLLLVFQQQGDCWKRTSIPKVRAAFLKQLPESDLKADYDILLPATSDFQANPSVHKIRQAVAKYPNSARLQFRLGVYGQDKQALQRAAELDPNNALPVYYLAHQSSADKALALIAQANHRKAMNWYLLPEKGKGLADTLIEFSNSSIQLPAYMVLRQDTRIVCKYALELQKQGRTDEALAALEQAKATAWKLIGRDNTNVMDLLVTTALVQGTLKYEKQIYTQIGSKAGLASLEAEKKRLDYLTAGGRYYTTEVSGKDMLSMMKHIALLGSMLFVGVAQLFVLLLSGIWWEILLLRSRKQPGSELHLEATRVFSTGGLTRLYAFIYLPMAIAFTVATLTMSETTFMPVIAFYAAGMLLPLVLLWRANAAYKKAYRGAAESAGQEVSKSIPDRREFQRRMIGVQGGAMVCLVILGLLVSGGTKVASGTYPWEPFPSMTQTHQRESQFVEQLLTGKIKVPQKYIDEVKAREAKRKHP